MAAPTLLQVVKSPTVIAAIMVLQDYFNFLADDDIRIKGSRIGIESVLYEYIYRARTPEEIAQQFETITLEQVYATILYYLHKKEEVSAYIADWLEFCRQQREEQQRNPSPARLRFRQLKAEAAVRQQELSESTNPV